MHGNGYNNLLQDIRLDTLQEMQALPKEAAKNNVLTNSRLVALIKQNRCNCLKLDKYVSI